MNRKIAIISLAVVLSAGLFVSPARADSSNQEVQVKVNKPVEIPGRVLDPGTYDIRLLSFGSHVVGVWSPGGRKFYGLVETEPTLRMRRLGKVRVDLAKSDYAAPEWIKDWFYPGDEYGNRLVYPSPKAMHLAQASTPKRG
jgi:hypothetical protein